MESEIEKDKCALQDRIEAVKGDCTEKSKLSQAPNKKMLLDWLNGTLKIKMTDGRVLVGNFFCTDKDSNVILGSSGEYLREEDVGVEQPRALGLVMVPGRHIISIHYLQSADRPNIY